MFQSAGLGLKDEHFRFLSPLRYDRNDSDGAMTGKCGIPNTYPCQPTTGEGKSEGRGWGWDFEELSFDRLRTSGVGELFDPVYNLSSGMTAKMSISKSM